MKPGSTLSALLAGSIIGSQALAQPEMRPGLWKHSFTVESQSGEVESAMREMQQQLESMPPEQRRIMEQMMAAQGVQFGPSGQSVKVCVSEEQAARGEVPQKDGYCTQEITARSGNTIRTRFQCSDNPPSSGEGEVTFISPTAYTGKAIINTTAEGRAERVTMQQSGEWLSSDCGRFGTAFR